MSRLDVGKWRIEAHRKEENFMAIRASLRLTLRLFNQVRDAFVAFHKAGQAKTTART